MESLLLKQYLIENSRLSCVFVLAWIGHVTRMSWLVPFSEKFTVTVQLFRSEDESIEATRDKW